MGERQPTMTETALTNEEAATREVEALPRWREPLFGGACRCGGSEGGLESPGSRAATEGPEAGQFLISHLVVMRLVDVVVDHLINFETRRRGTGYGPFRTRVDSNGKLATYIGISAGGKAS
jgi:hypothetical protein